VLAAAGAAAEALVGMWVLNWLVPVALGTQPLRIADGGARKAPRPSPAIPLSGVAALKRAGAVEPKAIKAGSPRWRGATRDAAGSMPSWSRRTLLQRGGAIAVGSIAATAIGRVLLERQRTPTTAATLPPPKSVPALPTGADLGIAGLTPIVVPNDKFYRIDTVIAFPPNVDVTTWKLKVTGMVDHPIELTYDELIQLPIIEQYVTIACVSNYVGGDLVGNPTLYDAVQKAKKSSVPIANIDRAVKRGSGAEAGGADYQTIMYEGYGPNGVAVLVECLTDNRNRAASEVRIALTRNGGTMADPGSVSYLFNRKGVVIVSKVDGMGEDDVLVAVLEAGAEEVNDLGEAYEVVSEATDLVAVRSALQAAGIDYDSADASFVPSVYVPLDEDGARKVFRLIEALEDSDDVQNVWANYDVSDEIMESVG